MKLPLLFRQVHRDQLSSAFYKHGPVFRLEPREPLGAVTAEAPGVEDCVFTVVTIRAINERGVIRFEAFSEADLKAATEWAEKHRDTAVEDFDWLPSIVGAPA